MWRFGSVFRFPDSVQCVIERDGLLPCGLVDFVVLIVMG